MMLTVIGNILKQEVGGFGVSLDWYCRLVTRNTLKSSGYEIRNRVNGGDMDIKLLGLKVQIKYWRAVQRHCFGKAKLRIGAHVLNLVMQYHHREASVWYA